MASPSPCPKFPASSLQPIRLTSALRRGLETELMPWFRNHYVCIACEGHWLAEAAAAQDDDCPFCRAYDVTPYRSDDWTRIVEPQGQGFVVLECAKVGAHGPDYRRRGRFNSRDAALAFVAGR
jgi:hypothetical protein